MRLRWAPIARMLALAVFVGTAIARAFEPYEAIAYLRPGSPAGEHLARVVTEAARKRGYARIDDGGRVYVVPQGFVRLMTFESVECREYAGEKCPHGPTVVTQGLIFVDREIRSDSIVIRFMQWCATSCEGRVKATVDRLTEEIENSRRD